MNNLSNNDFFKIWDMTLQLLPLTKRTRRNDLNDLQNTAFTSLLMGIFLNSPMISPEDLVGLSKPNVFKKYGTSFRQSLQVFASYDTIEQVHIIHILQK